MNAADHITGPTTGTQVPAPRSPGVDRRAMVVNLVLTAVLDVGLALVAFRVAKHLTATDQIAYLASGIGPLTMMVITWIRARSLSGVSVIVLVVLLLSAAAAFIGGPEARLLIVKDSVVTGGFGLACLVSPLFARPLMFYFGARFATDGTHSGLAYWSGLWRYPDFRRSQYVINSMWGVAFLVEAAVRIVIAYTVADFQVANTITTILPWVVLAGLIFVTITLGRRARTAAAARIRAGNLAPVPAQDSGPLG